jgi:hypothetical protein
VSLQKIFSVWVLLIILFLAFCLLGSVPPTGAQTNLERIVGTWKLISVEGVRPNGEVVYDWMGRNPVGLIIYDLKGNVSFQLMRDPRPMMASDDLRKSSVEELKDAIAGYYAYFGTYEIDEKGGFVIHNIQGSLRPSEVGTRNKRFIQLLENRLIHTSPPFKSALYGEERYYRLVWERAEKNK